MNVYIPYTPNYSAMQGPCPDGFHVPLRSEWQAVYNIWTFLGGGSKDGTNFGIALKLPFAGDRHSSSASVEYQRYYGNYWSSTPNNTGSTYSLYFSSTIINLQNTSNRAFGYSVRCFKNSPVVPTSSWVKLYGTSIESGGIFWSSVDGLISLSYNGQTWITIMDKNLGATTVWNSGDTLSEANCGKYYQWGNNYGFQRTGSITTSSTKVDASNYGPWDYYNSSTFITISSSPYDWSSVQNDNLWGSKTPSELYKAYIGEYSGRLPSAYQEVEYISSSSAGPRIDLGFTPTIKTVSHIKFKNLAVTGGVIYGFSNNYSNAYRVFNYQSKIYYYVGGSGPVGSTLSANTLYEFEVGNYYVKNVGASTNLVSQTALTSMSVTGTITLNRDAAGNASSRNTWYYVKIWDNGTLVRDMIPCYRKSDNVIGMYDLAHDVFYTNAGTGSFTKGPDVD